MGGGYGGGGSYGGNNYGMMGGGMGMMGGGMMMGYPQQQRSSSMFSLSNVLTGVALYSMYRSMTGGGFGGGGYGQGYNNYGPREVHIYDHREHKPSDPNDLKPIMGTLGLPQSVTGEKIDMQAKTMEEIAEQTPVQNVTTENGTSTVADPLPPLPFDNEPKIYFGYGYAYGYQNATVNLVSSADGQTITIAPSSDMVSESSTTAQSSNGDSSTKPQGPESSSLSSDSSSSSQTPEDSNMSTTMKSQVE